MQWPGNRNEASPYPRSQATRMQLLSLAAAYRVMATTAVHESDSDASSTEEVIREELSEIPLGELQQLRERLGTKKFDAVLQKAREERAAKTRGTFKRANKNRPREVSSKKPVPRFQEVIQLKKHDEIRDPRFDERTGSFNEGLFKKSYAFLDEVKRSEKQLVEREAKKARNPEKRAKLQTLIQQMESREAAEEKEEGRRALLREHRKVERELVKQGKKPFFIKKSTRKQLELAQRYKELKRAGKLEKFLSKKRKKNASRDRKQLPFKRKP